MKKKKYIPEKEQYHDFTIFDVTSALDDFKLAFFLNKHLNIQLKCEPDLEVHIIEGSKPDLYSLYHCDLEKGRAIFLIHNIKDTNPLMKSYFLIIQGIFGKTEEKMLTEGVESISEVLTINRIQLQSAPIKTVEQKKLILINTILTDLEYHMLEITRKKNEEKVTLKVTQKGSIKRLYT